MSQIQLWNRVADDHALLVDFLEWLERHDAVDLSPQSEECGIKLLDDFKPSRLADLYFQINRSKLDDERRHLLAKASKLVPKATQTN